MSDKKYPIVKIRPIDPDGPPTAHNMRLWIDDREFSEYTTGAKWAVGVGDMNLVTLTFYAHVDADIPVPESPVGDA